MRPVERLALWGALFVGLLLLVPVALPPARQPTFPTPAWVQGDVWRYAVVPTYGAAPVASEATLRLSVEAPPASFPGAGLVLNFSGLSGPASAWPFSLWAVAPSDASWVGWGWNCSGAPSLLSLAASRTLPFAGMGFPLEASGSVVASAPGRSSGACAGNVSVVESGSYARELAPGGSVSCLLYLCNTAREYRFTVELLVEGDTGGPPLAAWYLRGVYDPAISGFEELSFSPSASGTYLPGSVNLSLTSATSLPTNPLPPAWESWGATLLLLLLLPLVAFAWEVRRARESDRRHYDRDLQAVLAALTEQERTSLPVEEEEDLRPAEVPEGTPPGGAAPPPP